MLKVGITGGIGSGKTYVCAIFEQMGIPVYYADSRAKQLLYRDPKLKSEVKSLLGTGAYHSNGRPNRGYIGSKIFADKALLQQMNELVHPAVAEDSQRWHSQQQAPYTLKEAALLVENGSYKTLDKLIVVTAPEDIRIARVVKRDKTTTKAVRSRIKNQLPDAAKVAVADYIIVNDGSKSVLKQVAEIHRQLI